MRTLLRLLLLLTCGSLGVGTAWYLVDRLDRADGQQVGAVVLPGTRLLFQPEPAPERRTPALDQTNLAWRAESPRYQQWEQRIESRSVPPSPDDVRPIHTVAATAAPPVANAVAEPSTGSTGVTPAADSTSLLLAVIDKLVQSQQRAEVMVASQPAAPITPPPAEPILPPFEPEISANAPPSLPIVQRDVNSAGDVLSITARNEDVRALLESLAQQGLNIVASSNVQGTVSVNLHEVSLEEALQAILKTSGLVSRREGKVIFVGTPQDFDLMRVSQERIATRVFHPNYVTAAELQALLTPLITPSVGRISVTSPSAVGIGTDNTSAGGDSYSSGDAVVVQDYESVLLEVEQVIANVDRRPLQVAIEAMILSVKLDDAYQFGVDFQVLRDKQHVRLGWGNPRLAPLEGGGQVNPVTGARIGEFQFDTGGLKFAFLDDSLGMFINALETVGDTNVIATPKLLCLNKQRAEILIGAQLGYVSTTITETAATQNVEFLEVGAQLRLRPFVSNDGLIRMEVHPELSTGQVRVQDGFTLPEKELTQVTTNILCPDGATVVIGGLMREDLQVNQTQVPLMGSLPIVGPLFRNKQETVERREIIVLITPRVVYEGDLFAEGSREQAEIIRRQDERFMRTSPLGKLHLGESYLRKAQAAWAEGNLVLARHFIRLAVHYNPLDRDALALRDVIMAANRGVEVLPDDAILEGTELLPSPTVPLLEPADSMTIETEERSR